MGLVITDTFKEHDNEEVTKFCRENNSVIIIVKFQPLDITVNKRAKRFIKVK